jgi:hypothetical protein
VCTCDDWRDAGFGRQRRAEPGEAWLMNFDPASLAWPLLHLAQGAANSLSIDQGEMAHRTAAEQVVQQHGEGSAGGDALLYAKDG